MNTLSPNILYNGTEIPLPEVTMLHAGALSLQYMAGALRYIKLGDHEILRQIYAAVRDQNWGTIPGVLSEIRRDIQSDRFELRFTSHHQQKDIDFTWTGTITGHSDDTVVFHFAGEAHSTFQSNRVGFCVLHPMTCAGLPCRVEKVDGTQQFGRFPLAISPHQPFKNIRAIKHEISPEEWVEVRMEGDTFEMEDQRNWTDASYKTYCTPLEKPFPVLITPGTRIEQTITVKLLIPVPTVNTPKEKPISLTLNPTKHYALPSIGLGSASHDEPLSEKELTRLKALNLAHLRVDLRPGQPSLKQCLQSASETAQTLGLGLEGAIHLTENAEAELRLLGELIDRLQPPIARWLIFRHRKPASLESDLKLSREILGKNVPIGGGTDAYFTELNRNRPPLDALDLVSYSINPQVHAFDNASLVETLPVLPVTVDSAGQFSGDKPIVISPITLKIRWNPNATASANASSTNEVPAQVDPRQMSLFGAGWTLGSLKYAAQSGVQSATYYETMGWLGVMERESGSPVPEKFPSIAGSVYPMYHVFADIGEFVGGEVAVLEASHPLLVEGMALQKNGHLRMMLANFTAEAQAIHLTGLNGTFKQRKLDAQNAVYAMCEPEAYRTQAGETLTAEGNLQLTLSPYALITLDGSSS